MNNEEETHLCINCEHGYTNNLKNGVNTTSLACWCCSEDNDKWESIKE